MLDFNLTRSPNLCCDLVNIIGHRIGIFVIDETLYLGRDAFAHHSLPVPQDSAPATWPRSTSDNWSLVGLGTHAKDTGHQQPILLLMLLG